MRDVKTAVVDVFVAGAGGGNPAPILMPCSFYANPNFHDVDIEA